MLAGCLAGCGSEQIAGPTPAPADQPATDPPGAAPPPAPQNPPDDPVPGPSTPAPPPPPAAPVVLVGAGDIGVCGSEGPARTSALLDAIDGIVFTAGDHAYSNGTRDEFLRCYEPSWGRHRWRTRPSPGNHDYRTDNAAGYFDYFGDRAGPYGRGYYRFSAGAWQVYSLNSNVPAGAGSAQLEWLRAELRAQPSACIAAIWHHALASSGPHGGVSVMREVWRALRESGADVVVAAHDHLYERFTPLDEDGFPSATGIRAFVAGTGGAPLYQTEQIAPGSQVRAPVWGVLKLTLREGAFDWEFVSVDGEAFRDQGSQACGPAPGI